MPEVQMCVKATPERAAGEIINAITDRRITHIHLQHLAHVDKCPFNSSGLRLVNSHTYRYQERVCRYRWERVSTYELKRTNLWTGDEVVYGSRPIEDPDKPGSTIHCHVPELFSYAVKHHRHKIYGTAGREVMFGGREKSDMSTLSLCWDDIEANSDRQRTEPEFAGMTWGRLDLQHFLCVPIVSSPEDDTIIALQGTAPDVEVTEEPEEPIKVRGKCGNIEALADALGETVERLHDPNVSIGRTIPAFESPFRSIDATPQPLSRFA